MDTDVAQPVCRFCRTPLVHTFCDLGMSPPSNAYLTAAQLNAAENFFPLHAFVCEACKLVQLEQFQAPGEIFSDYAYFSSYSESWLQHARGYVEAMVPRLSLNSSCKVVEIASNDGYLLQYFLERAIPVLGIEPAANVAAVAQGKGIPTKVAFFGVETARQLVADGVRADLLLGNNVLAHVPDINDFVAGMAILLGPSGTITMEFPHLLKLMAFNQFDTIYHEHFSYFSLHAVQAIFAAHSLSICDVDEIPTHGGSLRIYARHAATATGPTSAAVTKVLADERAAGLCDTATYTRFQEQVQQTKRTLLSFLMDAKDEGLSIVGYGAAAKGNTLLNYCGIRADFIDYIVDRNPHKQGRFLPGTHIPILGPDRIAETKPDIVLILPWNLQHEVVEQMQGIRAWGGRFVVPIPEVKVIA
jgi:2-polyprenyl-3-methyl-5-hydroxy-6-metoxy-1,4-benzoquinol methylase